MICSSRVLLSVLLMQKFRLMQLELMFILNMSADVLSRVEPLKLPSKEPEGAEIFG